MAKPDLKPSRLEFERLDVLLACILAAMMLLAVVVVGSTAGDTETRNGSSATHIAR
jgi:hypothetical protein